MRNQDGTNAVLKRGVHRSDSAPLRELRLTLTSYLLVKPHINHFKPYLVSLQDHWTHFHKIFRLCSALLSEGMNISIKKMTKL